MLNEKCITAMIIIISKKYFGIFFYKLFHSKIFFILGSWFVCLLFFFLNFFLARRNLLKSFSFINSLCTSRRFWEFISLLKFQCCHIAKNVPCNTRVQIAQFISDFNTLSLLSLYSLSHTHIHNCIHTLRGCHFIFRIIN